PPLSTAYVLVGLRFARQSRRRRRADDGIVPDDTQASTVKPCSLPQIAHSDSEATLGNCARSSSFAAAPASSARRLLFAQSSTPHFDAGRRSRSRARSTTRVVDGPPRAQSFRRSSPRAS